jgi:S1-C subfamily serine protease
MKKFWKHFVSNGRGAMKCAPLGFYGHPVPMLSSLAKRLGLRQPTGIEIWRIARGAPAASAGLRVGDILVTLGERPTSDANCLAAILGRLPRKEAVPAKVVRDDEMLTQMIVPDDCREIGGSGYGIYDGRSDGKWGKRSR